MKRVVLFLSCLFAFVAANATPKAVLYSPDGRIALTLETASDGLCFSLKADGVTLFDRSPLSFDLENGSFGHRVTMKKSHPETVRDVYDLPVGKTSHVDCVSSQMRVELKDRTSGIRVDMILRVFNDGAAFRYEFPQQEGMDSLVVKEEHLDLRPSGGPKALAMFLPGFINSHEWVYERKAWNELPSGRLMDLPVTLSYPKGLYVSVTEANMIDYAGMYLVHEKGALRSRLSPRLDIPGVSVVADLPHKTPWRVFIVGRRPGELLESNILTTLADSCKLDDVSWLKPGKTTFPWWNDTCTPKSTFQWGNNFQTAKYYIDFAAESGLEYHSVYGYGDMPWYYDDGPSFGQAGPNADLTRPDPRLDFGAVCRYAASKGVDIHVWLNWAALYKDIDRVFDKFNEWGVKGMMVDFMDRDDQQMIQIQEDILRKAAEHHLFIQFHGASKPSGLVRTYPNEFTREGTLNYEVYKWDQARLMGSGHDLDVAYARLVAGAADYHLGGFRSVPYDSYVPQYHAPIVTSTRCHMLAMYVVMESYLAMVADDPEAYKDQDGFDFLKAVPTSWDETRIPQGEIGEYLLALRRKGDTWYAGAINNESPRDITLGFDFLSPGDHLMTLYTDAPDAETDPNHLVVRKIKVRRGDRVDIHLARDGGFAAIISEDKIL
ncbi:MAG: glycoside hydrolase family 97 protein [Bacteroidales bacterium]|nr:glycoside hydrolase family 97 protein [Bacteroidales bacterium]